MSIGSSKRINEIWRIGNDKVKRTLDAIKKIAFHDFDMGDPVNRSIDSTELKRAPIDIGQRNTRSKMSGGIRVQPPAPLPAPTSRILKRS